MHRPLGLTAISALLLLNACGDSKPSTSTAGTGGASATPPDFRDDGFEGQRLPSCVPGAFSAAEQRDIVSAAIVQLEADQRAEYVRRIDTLRAVWTNDLKFARLVAFMYEEAGCSELASEVASSASAPNYYCGPRQGPATLIRPPVSQCLNRLCELHDACLALCDQPTRTCSWDTSTAPCDEQFAREAAQCEDVTLGDALIRRLVSTLSESAQDYSCSNMLCPTPVRDAGTEAEFGALGAGVCATDPASADCTQCLAATDVGDRCFDHAVAARLGTCDPATDASLCRLANCPAVAECYAGYGRGLPGNTSPLVAVDDPSDWQWTVVLGGAVLPDYRPDGGLWADPDPDASDTVEWDVDYFGSSPPDPFAWVLAPDSDDPIETPRLRDSLRPVWNLSLGPYSTEDLGKASFFFVLNDADFDRDDAFAFCELAPLAPHFKQRPFDIACQGATLTLQLIAHPPAADSGDATDVDPSTNW